VDYSALDNAGASNIPALQGSVRILASWPPSIDCVRGFLDADGSS
jgi:hypothetical protein